MCRGICDHSLFLILFITSMYICISIFMLGICKTAIYHWRLCYYLWCFLTLGWGNSYFKNITNLRKNVGVDAAVTMLSVAWHLDTDPHQLDSRDSSCVYESWTADAIDVGVLNSQGLPGSLSSTNDATGGDEVGVSASQGLLSSVVSRRIE